MKRWALFTSTLILSSTLAFAQAVVTPSGQATTQGVAVPVAPVSPPLVATPLMHLGTAPTTNVGTSTAAITSATATPEPPSAVPIRPEIDLGPETVYVGPTMGGTTAANNNNANANSPVTVNGRQLFDLGVHSGGMAMDDGTQGRSLGEIARETRQRTQGAQARTFTNADVERMGNAGGGVSGAATAQNTTTNTTYPGNNGVINTEGVAGNTGAANGTGAAGVATPTNTPPTSPSNEQATPPSNPAAAPNAPQPSNGNAQKPSAGTTPHKMSRANVPANPADQNAASAANDQNNDEQRTLPKSGSFLPLMAIVGLGATAAGLLSRK